MIPLKKTEKLTIDNLYMYNLCIMRSSHFTCRAISFGIILSSLIKIAWFTLSNAYFEVHINHMCYPLFKAWEINYVKTVSTVDIDWLELKPLLNAIECCSMWWNVMKECNRNVM